jgi:hypothetical protein
MAAADKYRKAEVWQQYALTSDALQWWSERGFQADALRPVALTDDDLTLDGRWHPAAIKAAFAFGSTPHFDHAAAGWVHEHQFPTSTTADAAVAAKDKIAEATVAFFRAILGGGVDGTKGTAVLLLDVMPQGAGAGAVAAEAKARNAMLLAMQVVLQPSRAAVEAESRRMAELVRQITEGHVDAQGGPDIIIQQKHRAHYDGTLGGTASELPEHVRGARLALSAEPAAAPVEPEEVENLRKQFQQLQVDAKNLRRQLEVARAEKEAATNTTTDATELLESNLEAVKLALWSAWEAHRGAPQRAALRAVLQQLHDRMILLDFSLP